MRLEHRDEKKLFEFLQLFPQLMLELYETRDVMVRELLAPRRVATTGRQRKWKWSTLLPPTKRQTYIIEYFQVQDDLLAQELEAPNPMDAGIFPGLPQGRSGVG